MSRSVNPVTGQTYEPGDARYYEFLQEPEIVTSSVGDVEVWQAIADSEALDEIRDMINAHATSWEQSPANLIDAIVRVLNRVGR